MTDGDLQPLDGGHSGETFASTAGGEPVVVRIYGGRSRSRGPLAPELDAVVLRLMRGIVPVPAVLEVRRGAADHPGLLVTERLPGVRGDLLLPTLDQLALLRLGGELGRVVDRLRHVPTGRAGRLTPPDLVVEPWEAPYDDLESAVETLASALTSWSPRERWGLSRLVGEAVDRLDGATRTCLVHGDLNPKNLLVDPATLALTGVLDWEFAHSGSPYADLGNLLRFERDAPPTGAYVAAVLAGAGLGHDDLARARAADLVALVDLAARRHDPASRNPVTDAADRLLRHRAGTGDLDAWPD